MYMYMYIDIHLTIISKAHKVHLGIQAAAKMAVEAVEAVRRELDRDGWLTAGLRCWVSTGTPPTIH